MARSSSSSILKGLDENPTLQCLPFEILHGDEGLAFMLPNFVDCGRCAGDQARKQRGPLARIVAELGRPGQRLRAVRRLYRWLGEGRSQSQETASQQPAT